MIILLSGSNGQLGKSILISSKNKDNIIKINKNDLDISDFKRTKFYFEKYKPNIVINAAAYTNVDKAEINKADARNINVLGLNNIIKSLPKDSKIIHKSTDHVFKGDRGDYKEDDSRYPINYYGKTKLEAENILIGSNIDSLIIRPNVLYSNDLNKSHFLSWIVHNMINNKKISIVTDQKSNPTYIPDLIKIILDSILFDYEGIYHFGSEDSLTRYEFALKVCKYFKFNAQNIIPIKSTDLNQAALRPQNSSLNCSKIKNEFNIELFSTDCYLNEIS